MTGSTGLKSIGTNEKPTKVEIDQDQDIKLDTWQFHNEQEKLIRVERDTTGNGKVDMTQKK
jgi:hypothetical protein